MSDLTNSPINCRYSSYVFPTETETVELAGKPIYASDGRTIIYIEWTIHLKWVLATVPAAASTDITMFALRQILTAPAAEFHYSNVGFGNLDINVGSGGKRDVVWGPKPISFRYKPTGANQAAELDWIVQVAIPECANARYQFALMEAVYKLNFDIDQSGYTTRVYSGHLRIPQTRSAPGARGLTDTADAYRERIVPPLLPGFRRIPGSFDISEDKCRLDWSIRDVEEGPNFPPPGVVVANMDYSVSNGMYLYGTWAATLKATYEMSRDVPRSIAFGHFISVVADKTRRAAAVMFIDADGRPARNTVLFRSLTMREPEIYGKKGAAFSADWTYCSKREDILLTSAMWIPVPNSNWQLWANSMTRGAWSPRGFANMRNGPGEDTIIDLCQQPQAIAPGQVTLRALPPEIRTLRASLPPYPPPNTSWMQYLSTLHVEPQDGSVVLKPMPLTSVAPTPSDPPILRGVLDDPIQNQLRGLADGLRLPAPLRPYAAASGQAPAVIQARTTPTIYVVLEGHAIRAGYDISPPTLRSYGGQPATPANGRGYGFGSAVLQNWLGVPIVGCYWRLRYVLPDAPTSASGVMPVPSSGDLTLRSF
jgi:hypothetical protein